MSKASVDLADKAARQKKLQQKEAAKSVVQDRHDTADERTDDDGKMDFGGIPDRDLKKNLGGCG